MVHETETDRHGAALEAAIAARDSDLVRTLLFGSTAPASPRQLTEKTMRLLREGFRIGVVGNYVLRESVVALTLRFNRPDLLEDLLQAKTVDGQLVHLRDLLTHASLDADQAPPECLIAAILERSKGRTWAEGLGESQGFLEIALTTSPDSAALMQVRSDPHSAALIKESEMHLALRSAPAALYARDVRRRSKLA